MANMQQSSPSATQSGGRYAFPAYMVAMFVLALGPWMVRLSDVGPVAAGFWRVAIATPFLLLFGVLAQKGRQSPSGKTLVIVVVAGLFFAADLAVWHIGIRLTKLANAVLFGNSASFVIVIYGFIWLRQAPEKVQILALVLAAGGAALLMGSSYELSPNYLTGDLFALAAGGTYAVYMIAIKQARETMPAMLVLAVATAAATLPLLLTALALGEKVMPGVWTPLLLLSFSSQVLGQGLLVYAVRHLSAMILGLGLLVQPVVGAVIGWLVYGETLGTADIFGAVLITVALFLIKLTEKNDLPSLEGDGEEPTKRQGEPL